MQIRDHMTGQPWFWDKSSTVKCLPLSHEQPSANPTAHVKQQQQQTTKSGTHSHNPSSRLDRYNPGDSLTASLRTEIFCLHTYRRVLCVAPNLFLSIHLFLWRFCFVFQFFPFLYLFPYMWILVFYLKEYYLCIYY